MSFHADVLLIRREVRATIGSVLATFGAEEPRRVARGSYEEVLGGATEAEVFAVQWVDGWTILVGASLSMYGHDDELEELATQLGCELLVANAVGTSGSYGFACFNPKPTRQFAIDEGTIVLDEGEVLPAERGARSTSFGESDLMLVLARHAVELRAAWALPDWEAWGGLHPIQPVAPGGVLRARRQARLGMPTAASVDANGWTRCPECSRRFKVSDPSAFSSGKHKCGKHLALVYG